MSRFVHDDYSAALTYLIRRTWFYYHANLENLLGHPVFGRMQNWLAKPSNFLDAPISPIETWILRITTIAPNAAWDALLALTAFGMLALPWMNPGSIRGYQFLLNTSSLNADVAQELQSQLVLAVAFLLLCLLRPLIAKFVSGKKLRTFTRWSRRFGVGTDLLIGNLFFHILVLRIIFGSVDFPSVYAKDRPLLFTGPRIGFVIFCYLILWLTARLKDRGTVAPETQ